MAKPKAGTEYYLSGSALARRLNLPLKELFGLLAENAWIVRAGDQWKLTGKGEFEGGKYLNNEKFGPYIGWPASILNHRLFSDQLDNALLNAATLGGRMGLSARQTNLFLLELGLVGKGVKGWELTVRGKALGGVQEEYMDSGVPHVCWPATLVANPVIIENLQIIHAYEHIGETTEGDLFDDSEREIHLDGSNGLRALDGHVLRSKAELMICHWLYMSEIVHAHRRKLPVDGDYRCDFYLPALHLYIEYWGDESAPGQLAAKLEKKTVYSQRGLQLLELSAVDLPQLDEVLPRKLLKYGLAVY